MFDITFAFFFLKTYRRQSAILPKAFAKLAWLFANDSLARQPALPHGSPFGRCLKMARPFYIWKLSLVLFSDESRPLSTNLKWTWMWNCNREGWSLDHFSANTSLWGKEKVAWWLRPFHAKGNMYDVLHSIHNWPTVRTLSLEKLVAADGAVVNFPLLHLGVASNFLWLIHLRLVVRSMVSFYELYRTVVSSLRATRAWWYASWKSRELFGPKSQLSKCNMLVLKSWAVNLLLM